MQFRVACALLSMAWACAYAQSASSFVSLTAGSGDVSYDSSSLQVHALGVQGSDRHGPWSLPRKPHLDSNEETEVVLVPMARIKGLIASGRITHALVIAAFSFLHLYNPPRREPR